MPGFDRLSQRALRTFHTCKYIGAFSPHQIAKPEQACYSTPTIPNPSHHQRILTMNTPITIDQTTARRLAISAQRLAGPHPPATADSVLDVMRAIRCLQLDPIRAVERTQYPVLHSRLGHYDREHLHNFIYGDRHLMEYWAHAASIVLI